jgi:hypothetical protein
MLKIGATINHIRHRKEKRLDSNATQSVAHGQFRVALPGCSHR